MHAQYPSWTISWSVLCRRHAAQAARHACDCSYAGRSALFRDPSSRRMSCPSHPSVVAAAHCIGSPKPSIFLHPGDLIKVIETPVVRELLSSGFHLLSNACIIGRVPCISYKQLPMHGRTRVQVQVSIGASALNCIRQPDACICSQRPFNFAGPIQYAVRPLPSLNRRHLTVPGLLQQPHW